MLNKSFQTKVLRCRQFTAIKMATGVSELQVLGSQVSLQRHDDNNVRG